MSAAIAFLLCMFGPPVAEPVDVAPASKLPGAAPAPVAEQPPTGGVEPLAGIATVAAEDAAVPPPPPAPAIDTPHPPAPKKTRAPRPIRWRFDPFLELGTLTIADPGYRAFDSGRNLVQLGTGLRIDARVGGRVFFGTGLRYGFARTDRGIYDGALRTRLVMHEPQLLARLAIVLVEGVDVVGQLDGGPSFRRVELDSDERSTRTRSIGGSFAARAGLSLYLPKAWLVAKGAARATAGIDLLFGSALRTKLGGRPHPDAAKDDIGITGQPIGEITMSGFVWTIGLFVRVM